MLIEVAGKLHRLQHTGEHLFWVGASQHSTQDLRGTMSPVLALTVSVMVLDVVVLPPCLVGKLYLRPVAWIGKCVVCEPALDGEQGFGVVSPRPAWANAFLADIQDVIELQSNIGIENPTTIGYKRFRSPVAPDSIHQDRKIVPLILCRGDSGGKRHSRKVLKDGDHVHGLGVWKEMLFNVSDISTPELVPPACLKWHLQFRAGCRFRLLLDAIEPTIGCHAPATGRRTHLDCSTQKRGVNAILSQQGILLEFANLVSQLKCVLAQLLSGSRLLF